MKNPGLRMAIENLCQGRIDAESVVAIIAGFLHRKETSLLSLRRAGLPPDVVNACFLLGHCGDSLDPERMEEVRANPLARSRKILEIRARVEEGDRGKNKGGIWELHRESLLRALEILERGAEPGTFSGGPGRASGKRRAEPCLEWEE
jgi:hypothetical protein